MKKSFIILAIISLFFNIYSREHILESIEVITVSSSQTLGTADVNIRYITEGDEMAGTWFDVNYSGSERLVFSIEESYKDTLIKYFKKYKKWRSTAIRNVEEVTKEMADFEVVVMFRNIFGEAGMGISTLTFKFITISENEYLLGIMLTKVSSALDQYLNMDPDSFTLSNKNIEKLLKVLENTDYYIEKAENQERIEDKYQ